MLSNYRIKMGAVIVRKSTVISVGHNTTSYNKRYCHPMRKLHAEMSAVKIADRDDLSGCTIYVYREGYRGIPRMAKPCPDCERELRARNVKRVFYTTSEYPYFDVIEL